jgi:hypothetical protein
MSPPEYTGRWVTWIYEGEGNRKLVGKKARILKWNMSGNKVFITDIFHEDLERLRAEVGGPGGGYWQDEGRLWKFSDPEFNEYGEVAP